MNKEDFIKNYRVTKTTMAGQEVCFMGNRKQTLSEAYEINASQCDKKKLDKLPIEEFCKIFPQCKMTTHSEIQDGIIIEIVEIVEPVKPKVKP